MIGIVIALLLIQGAIGAFDVFAMQSAPRWVTNDPKTQDAYNALVTKVCPCVIVVHSQEVLPTMPRSPYATRGRLGRPGRRDVSVAGLLAKAANANELFDEFRNAAGL